MIFTCIYSFPNSRTCVYESVPQHLVDVMEQPLEISFLLSPCMFQKIELRLPYLTQQIPLPAESFWQPTTASLAFLIIS